MSEEPPEDMDAETSNVLVFRNTAGDPIAVPSDVVTAAERAYRCYMSRVAGMSWAEIATAEGYPTGASARYDVERYLSEGKALVVEASQRDMLILEIHRLDALQHAVWPGAMAGHVPSVTAALAIVNSRAKLVGLDPDKLDDAAAKAARNTVVVPPDDAGYIKALQRAAAQAEVRGSTVEEHDQPEQGERDGNTGKEDASSPVGHGERGAGPGDDPER